VPLLAYFDCFSGVSGDMILGALVDAGLHIEALAEELSRLGVPGFHLRAEQVQRAGIAATRVHVDLDEAVQPQRHLSDILAIVGASGLPEEDRQRGADVFRRLAEAEAAVHGTGTEEVHFHEVGALDAIVDVFGAIAGLRLLGVDACFASALPSGSGSARSMHGTIPVPAPATLALMAGVNAPMREDAGERGELVTPTGAALLTTMARFERPAMTIQRVGYGAGGRDPADRPNVLRLWLGEGTPQAGRRLVQIETNIDDMPAEYFGFVQERLFAAGAVDVWFSSIQMKKNRPGTMLSLLCPAAAEPEIAALLLRETSTLGIRLWDVRRHEAPRESLRFESSLGEVAIKVKKLPGEAPQPAPEYDSCREIALRSGIPLPEVYRRLSREAEVWLAAQAASAGVQSQGVP
jgi:uncharacterized protein (TIGR00299 family) protein